MRESISHILDRMDSGGHEIKCRVLILRRSSCESVSKSTSLKGHVRTHPNTLMPLCDLACKHLTDFNLHDERARTKLLQQIEGALGDL